MQTKFVLAMMAPVILGQNLVSQLSDGQPQAPYPQSADVLTLSTSTHTVYTTAVVPADGSASTPVKSDTCAEGPPQASYTAVPQHASTSAAAATNSGSSATPPAGTPPAGGTGIPAVGAPPAGSPPAGSAPAGGNGVPPVGTAPVPYSLSSPSGVAPAAATNGYPTGPGANNTITAGTPPAAGTSPLGSIGSSSPATKPSGAAGALEPGLGLAAAAAIVLGLL